MPVCCGIATPKMGRYPLTCASKYLIGLRCDVQRIEKIPGKGWVNSQWSAVVRHPEVNPRK